MKNNYIAEIQIKYKPKTLQGLSVIKDSKDSYEYLKQVWTDNINYKEEFFMVCLNRSNKILGYSIISVGGISGCIVDPKIVFQTALKANASSIILSHNHPSGKLRPSEPDRKITKKILEGGKLLDLPILDHIIITSDGYYSFADEGEL